MFGELTRDDIFRIETRRLWLRWPRPSDAPAIAAFASRPEVALMTGSVPHPYPPGDAERYIEGARAANAAGTSLNVVVTEKHGPRALVGTIGLDDRVPGKAHLGYILAPRSWGQGYATEAARAMVEAAFLLTGMRAIASSVMPVNLASARVLEKCGFVALCDGEEDAPARGGPIRVVRFGLEREVWRRARHVSRFREPERCNA